jgi:hypothetical protein
VEPIDPNQERVLYPAPRSTFAGREIASASTPARVSPLLSLAALFGTLLGAAFALPPRRYKALQVRLQG